MQGFETEPITDVLAARVQRQRIVAQFGVVQLCTETHVRPAIGDRGVRLEAAVQHPRQFGIEFLRMQIAELASAIDAHAVVPADVGMCVQFAIERLGSSEEHTSELQSLMRISYAVFCLKKKKTQLIAYSS